jgi:hypothetical protein
MTRSRLAILLANERRQGATRKRPDVERGALKATEVADSDYAAVAANFPRSVFTNRASFPFSLISRRIAL